MKVVIILSHDCSRVELSLSDVLRQEVSKTFGPTTNYLLFTIYYLLLYGILYIIVRSPSRSNSLDDTRYLVRSASNVLLYSVFGTSNMDFSWTNRSFHHSIVFLLHQNVQQYFVIMRMRGIPHNLPMYFTRHVFCILLHFRSQQSVGE